MKWSRAKLALISFVCCNAAYLRVHNLEAVLQNSSNEKLVLDLEVDDNEEVQEDIAQFYPCILIDGNVCKCLFDATLQFTDLTPTALECLGQSTKASKWFSIQLRASSDESQHGLVTSLPVRVGSNTEEVDGLITLVLPLTRNDVQRSHVLFQSLTSIAPGVVNEMIVFAPDSHVDDILYQLKAFAEQQQLSFDVTIRPESILFRNPAVLKTSYPYSIQMAVKLLASKLVKTQFYLTLDADVILLRSFSLDQLLLLSKEDDATRGLYHMESRLIHPEWWIGSANFLNLDLNDESLLRQPGKGLYSMTQCLCISVLVSMY